jgi:hypothetical protein
MRSRESIDEFKVGFRELVRGKIRRFHPSKLCNFDRARLAIDDRAVEEVQVDGLRRIVMDRGVVLVVNLGVYAQLFEKLSTQCFNERLVRFDFAPRELPQVRQVSIGSASGEQDESVSSNDCRYDCDH